MDGFKLENMRRAPKSTPTKGPRRICTFCLLVVIFPISLLCVPVYMRFLALRPHTLILSPTDMKLLNHESVVSTSWCRSQRLRMNSSFHAYLFAERPKIMAERKRVTIKKEMEIQDDMKKYWGFYLLKDSTVRLGGCARWPGSSVIVVKGPEDAARCAWLGELDSQEESDEISDEFDHHNLLDEEMVNYYNSYEKELTTQGPVMTGDPVQRNEADISNLLKVFHNLSEQKKNSLIRDLLIVKHEGKLRRIRSTSEFHELNGINLDGINTSESTERHLITKLGRILNEYDDESDDVGQEDLSDDEDEETILGGYGIGGGQRTPDHLSISGVFNQKNRAGTKKDKSNEEVRSSDSSSEEALRNCHGVVVVHEFLGQKQCNSSLGDVSDAMEWYPFTNNTAAQLININETGFYFFIFSNENEITNNTVIADIELNKTRFNTSKSIDVCQNTTDCELHLKFWSNQHILVEVPESVEENPECDSVGFNNFAKCTFIITAESVCQPRGSVYLVFLLLVPVIILLFAYV